jgi:hypothetical protein
MANQNAVRGVVLSAIALCFGVTALRYPIGSFAHAGAGLFPLLVSALLLLLGLITLIRPGSSRRSPSTSRGGT